MKKIKIKCLKENCVNSSYYYIKVYNSNDELLLDKKIKNEFYLEYEYNKLYKIVVTTNCCYQNRICKNVYFTKSNEIDTLYFIFSNPKMQYHKKITFKFSDHYYKGLKIEKGEIFLWQNHI